MPSRIDPALLPIAHFAEKGIPFHVFLEMKVVHLVRGEAAVCIPPKPFLTGDPFRPAVHGGVVSTLLDTAGGVATFTTFSDANDRCSTVDLRVDYLRPGPTGVDLVAFGQILRRGNRVAVTRMELFAGALPEEGDPARAKPIAIGHGVYNIIRVDEPGEF
ncbi:MAG: hotdog fold thioesterase [Myxococcales bacterium]|nr:hotdog fold thioesterase [Myxococcales bacterium]